MYVNTFNKIILYYFFNIRNYREKVLAKIYEENTFIECFYRLMHKVSLSVTK